MDHACQPEGNILLQRLGPLLSNLVCITVHEALKLAVRSCHMLPPLPLSFATKCYVLQADLSIPSLLFEITQSAPKPFQLVIGISSCSTYTSRPAMLQAGREASALLFCTFVGQIEGQSNTF